MKAIVYHEYGPPEVLRLQEIAQPSPADEEVLVRIRAASLNMADRHLMRGSFVIRSIAGLLRPKETRAGIDLAGEVVSIGARITQFRPGDEVFGAARGSFAEYVCAKESRLALKPRNATFEEAAATPAAATTALQGLRDKGRVQSGKRVLINGASGAVGTFAVQIAKALGAHVTAVCSTQNIEMIRSLGADRAVDYTREDFTRDPERYDVVFDSIGNHSLSSCLRVLRPDGAYVVNGGPMFRIVLAFFLSRFNKKIVFFIARIKQTDLNALKDLIEAKKIAPVIDRRYSLAETSDAMRYLEEGHARAKIVITP